MDVGEKTFNIWKQSGKFFLFVFFLCISFFIRTLLKPAVSVLEINIILAVT